MTYRQENIDQSSSPIIVLDNTNFRENSFQFEIQMLHVTHQIYQYQKEKSIQIKDNLESILFSLASKNNKKQTFPYHIISPLQNQIKLFFLFI